MVLGGNDVAIVIIFPLAALIQFIFLQSQWLNFCAGKLNAIALDI